MIMTMAMIVVVVVVVVMMMIVTMRVRCFIGAAFRLERRFNNCYFRAQ